MVAVSPPGAVPSLAEAAGGEATLSNAQASLPVSFKKLFIEAHFGSLAELLRPCPGQLTAPLDPWGPALARSFRALCSVDGVAAVNIARAY